jgi:hypothetical protein
VETKPQNHAAKAENRNFLAKHTYPCTYRYECPFPSKFWLRKLWNNPRGERIARWLLVGTVTSTFKTVFDRYLDGAPMIVIVLLSTYLTSVQTFKSITYIGRYVPTYLIVKLLSRGCGHQFLLLRHDHVLVDGLLIEVEILVFWQKLGEFVTCEEEFCGKSIFQEILLFWQKCWRYFKGQLLTSPLGAKFDP